MNFFVHSSDSAPGVRIPEGLIASMMDAEDRLEQLREYIYSREIMQRYTDFGELAAIKNLYADYLNKGKRVRPHRYYLFEAIREKDIRRITLDNVLFFSLVGKFFLMDIVDFLSTGYPALEVCLKRTPGKLEIDNQSFFLLHVTSVDVSRVVIALEMARTGGHPPQVAGVLDVFSAVCLRQLNSVSCAGESFAKFMQTRGGAGFLPRFEHLVLMCQSLGISTARMLSVMQHGVYMRCCRASKRYCQADTRLLAGMLVGV